jgi:uncharacterized membrane protein YkvA (DUF1232 family)
MRRREGRRRADPARRFGGAFAGRNLLSGTGYWSDVKMLRLALAWRQTAFRTLAAFADGRVPGHLKLFALAAAIFVVSPLNLLGDIPLLGAIDDAGLLTLVMLWFTRASTPYQNTIDG